MCVYSMIADHYGDKWGKWIPQQSLPPSDPSQTAPFVPVPSIYDLGITREEIEEVRKDMAEMKKLLERAREYDKKNNQPDCETQEKMKRIQELADSLGAEVTFP